MIDSTLKKLTLIFVLAIGLLIIGISFFFYSLGWKTVRYETINPYPDEFTTANLDQYPDISHCNVLVKSVFESEINTVYETSGLYKIRLGMYYAIDEQNIPNQFSLVLTDDTGAQLAQWDAQDLGPDDHKMPQYNYTTFESPYTLDLKNSKLKQLTLTILFSETDSCDSRKIEQHFTRTIERGIFRFST